jgi:DNA-binding SARP family transcriptional activator
VEIGLLGPVRLAEGNDQAPLASGIQRAILAVLALAGGRVMSYAGLIDAVWQEDLSAQRVHNLHFHVSRLRGRLRALDPGRPGSPIVTQAAGYRLDLTGVEADWREFGARTGLARELRRAGNLTGASITYASALALWRGSALADVAGQSRWLASEAARLDEQRVAVTEEQAETDLLAGRHHEITGELAWLVSQHPLRPRLTGLLMTALFRAGRQAEALAAYARHRAQLAADVGLDPTPDLQALHGRVLAGDPDLAWPPPLRSPPAVPAHRAGRVSRGRPRPSQ